MLSMLAAAPQITDSAETQQTQIIEFSDPVMGIASILEGFGLLNAEGNLTMEASQLLQAAYAAADGAIAQPEAEQAGMPKVQPDVIELMDGIVEAGRINVPAQNEAERTAILSRLAPLVNEYLKSLENAHSPSGAQTALLEAVSQAAPLQNAMAAAPVQTAMTADPVQTAMAAAPIETTPAQALTQTAPSQTAVEAFKNLIAAVENALSEKSISAQAPVVSNEEGEPAKPTQNTEAALASGTFGASFMEGLEPVADKAPAAQSAQTDTAQTVMNLVDSVSVQAKGGVTEFEVMLKPEHLGKLSIKLTQDADGLKAEIKAADPTVKTLLENELNSLQAMLREKGVEVHRIDVAYEASTLAFDSRQRQKQDSNAPESKRRQNVLSVSRASAYGAAQLEAAAAAPAVQDDARLALQGGSVEFSA
jgi:flagellar hook-length control protein FliK